MLLKPYQLTYRENDMSPSDREELISYIEEIRGDIRIAVHLGNLTIAGNLKEALAKAEKDLAA